MGVHDTMMNPDIRNLLEDAEMPLMLLGPDDEEWDDEEEEVDDETGMRLPTSRTYAVGGRWMGRVSGDAQKSNAIETDQEVHEVQEIAASAPKTSIIPLFVLVAVLTALISAGSIMLEGVWSYSTDATEGTASFDTSFKVSPKKSFELMNSI